jgi:hypothetical protein
MQNWHITSLKLVTETATNSQSMKYIIASTLMILLSVNVQAQNEIERERYALQGLQEFGFTVNIEGSQRVTSDTNLTPSNIRQQAVNQIVEANLRYVSDEEVSSSADIPFLHMHINMLELDNGLIPFSIELRLYQPVKLILNRDLQTSASTWETGMVGIVSHDQIHTINRAAENVLITFLDDFYRVNRSGL